MPTLSRRALSLQTLTSKLIKTHCKNFTTGGSTLIYIAGWNVWRRAVKIPFNLSALSLNGGDLDALEKAVNAGSPRSVSLRPTVAGTNPTGLHAPKQGEQR
jgi:hypothetical protein